MRLFFLHTIVVVVQLPSCIWLSVTPGTAACQAPLSSTISQSLLKFMSIESVMLSDYSILCHPLLFLPSIFPSIRVFFSESALCIRWLEYCSFSISPSDEYSGRISFRIDWFDLPAVQGILKSPAAQFESISSLVFSLLYGSTFTSILDYWKNHSFNYTDLCWQNDVLLFNTLSRFVIAFPPRSKHLYFHVCGHCLHWFWSPRK